MSEKNPRSRSTVHRARPVSSDTGPTSPRTTCARGTRCPPKRAASEQEPQSVSPFRAAESCAAGSFCDPPGWYRVHVQDGEEPLEVSVTDATAAETETADDDSTWPVLSELDLQV